MSFICSTTEKKPKLFIRLILIHFISLLKDCLYYITDESFSGEGLMRAHPEHTKDISSSSVQTYRGKTNGTTTAEELVCIFGFHWSEDSLGYRLSSLCRCSSCLKVEMTKFLIKRLKGHLISLLSYWNTSVSSTEMLLCIFFRDTPPWLPIMTY